MSQHTSNTEIQRAVEYLQESDEPLDSKINAIKNAADTGEFTIRDVLSTYADSVSTGGAVYPRRESQIQELKSAIEQEFPEVDLPSVATICQPHTVIETKEDVITQAINIYTDTDRPSDERQNDIKRLIQDARRDGINVSADEVLRSLKEFASQASTTSESDVSGVSVGMEEVTLATGIDTPDEVQADDEYVYRVNVTDDARIKTIDWYIGGTHAGNGKTILHSFEFPGVYTISVELADIDGNTDHISEEIEVVDPATIEVNIVGDTTVEAGDTVQYRADVTANNETVRSLEWELDNVPAGDGKVFSNTFNQDGDHTLSVTAHGESGLTVTESESITVETPTAINVELDAPETVNAGDSAEIHCSIAVENAYIESTTCKIGNEVIPVDDASSISVEHTFDEPGEYPVTVTASNNTGDTDTAVATINCYVEPVVEIVDPPEAVVRGDDETFEAEFDDRLSSSWGVTDASLTHVGDREAEVTFNSGIAEEAAITVEVENEVGDTETDSALVNVHEPTVDAAISYPDEVTAGHVVELSASETEVEYAEIDRIEWKLGDGMVIGRGETITYEFSSPGEYTVSATVHTDRGVGDTETVHVEVEPETDATAVIVKRGGPTTRDEFVLDGSNSVAENTTITSYTWEVDDGQELTGETATVTFDSPGEYSVTLTVETEAGDVDTEQKPLTVEQYTEVTADLEGPGEIVVGQQARFTARGSEPVNTTITEYNWSLNDQPAGTGEVFTQTFSTPGHYTVQVEVKTATGDSDTAATGVVVETPESEVTAGLELEFEHTPVVGETVTVTAASSTVKHGEVKEYEWTVSGDTLANTSESVPIEFPAYGENTISLEVTATDGVTDTVEETVYVTPVVSDPPYPELTEDSAKADVFGAAIELYEDNALTRDDQNRFAAHLVSDAHYYEIDVSSDEVAAHLVDVEALEVDESDISIKPESIEDEREDRKIDEDVEEDTEDDVDTGEWEINTEAGDDEDSSVGADLDEAAAFEVEDSEDESDEEDSDTSEGDLDDGMWDMGDDDGDDAGVLADEEDDPLGEAAEFDVDAAGDEDDEDDEEDGEETEVEEEDEDDEQDGEEPIEPGIEEETDNEPVDPDDLPSVDEDEIDERHKEVRISPETYDLGGSVLAMPNYAQDLIDFEYIMDDEDELVPDGVNGAGVIVAEDDLYIAIARVEGRDWSIHTAEKQRDIVKTYESHVLSGLDSPMQIVSVPTRFDLREHINMVNEVIKETNDDPEELLMNIGRSIYPNWLENFMMQNDMKERQFYVVVPLSAEQLHKFKGGSESLIEKIAETPVIGGYFERFQDESVDDITKYQCLRELNTRMNRLKSNLRRMDVKLDRVEDRDEAMSVLYHYFHNKEPDREVFPTGPFTTREKDATIGGVSVDHLLDEHEPAHDGVEIEGGKP